MVKISDDKLDLKELSRTSCKVNISVVEESYFITVFDVQTEYRCVRVYYVRSECSYFFKCTDDEMVFWRECFGLKG